MPRPLSPRAVEALMAHNTDQVFILLVTFWHGSEIYRCCLNTEPIISNGLEFTPTYFEFMMPEVNDRAPQSVEIRVDNVDQRMVDMLRRVVTPVQVKIELVLASQPDTIEMVIEDLFLREVNWNISSISGKLMIEDMLNAGFPADIYEPRTFQGIF
jgi:hypothetical protein